MQELAKKKKWMFARSSFLVFIKYYGPSFGLRYVGAMYVGSLHDISQGYKGISSVMKTKFNLPLPDNVDYFRLLGDRVELIDMTPIPPPEEGKEAAPPCLPDHGEIIVLQASSTPDEFTFSTKWSSFPRFAPPEPVIRTPTFSEQLLEDAECGFTGVDVKFQGGADDNKYTITAHRSALCTTQYFRRLFTTGVKEDQKPPQPDKEGFHLITPPPFANELTMRSFVQWIYTRRVPKAVQMDVNCCLNLSTPSQNTLT
jgi:hypothetical protein